MNYWNQRFSEDEYIYGKDANAFIQQVQPQLHIKGRALAIAEGEGRNAVYLAEQGMDVTTWDYAESGLEKTKKLANERNVSVKTKLVDLHNAEWKENEWNQIINVFGHFPQPLREKTLRGIKNAVKPGGYFITEVYSPYQIPYKSGGPQNPEMLYRPEEFLQLFNDWKIVHFFMGEVIRSEGIGHEGLSHVIQFIGQKLEK